MYKEVIYMSIRIPYVTYTPGTCPVKTLVQGAKVQHIGAFGLSFEPAKVVLESKSKTEGIVL